MSQNPELDATSVETKKAKYIQAFKASLESNEAMNKLGFPESKLNLLVAEVVQAVTKNMLNTYRHLTAEHPDDGELITEAGLAYLDNL